MENITAQMEMFIKAISKMACLMAEGRALLQTEISMRENGRMTR